MEEERLLFPVSLAGPSGGHRGGKLKLRAEAKQKEGGQTAHGVRRVTPRSRARGLVRSTKFPTEMFARDMSPVVKPSTQRAHDCHLQGMQLHCT
ncbi:hypothetical protein AAFF_G00185020 [Aldrovandia affinis]|uniref:Uncharacterized protein n=1 Tax=Aldrovandia affinis TaxID=143900 RepID=A0AAD7RJZ6_9TELE|nr:hypothetical protein AAFF_G00185020 [Aldrovandia affinis]